MTYDDAKVVSYVNSRLNGRGTTIMDAITRVKPRTAAQAMGLKPPTIPIQHIDHEAPAHAKMAALGRRSAAISADEREERRTRVLDFLQQVRVATRRDIDRVCGYPTGVSHNRVLETLYKRRLVERIENIDSSQSLYALTARGDDFATAPSSLPPLTTFEWQNATQQEHKLGVSAFMSVMLSPTPIPRAMGSQRIQEALHDGHYALLGEPLINHSYAEQFGKKNLPDAEHLDALYVKPEDGAGAVNLLYSQAWWYMIPPYMQGQDAVRIDMVNEEGTPLSQQELTATLMRKHPADAVLAPVSMKDGAAVAIEVERYAKPSADYAATMSRYGSAFGRKRFGAVIWACATGQILNSIISAAEKTGTSKMVYAFVYDTGRHGSFLKGTEFNVQ